MISDSTWRIRKDIPVALIFTMLAQVAVLLIWGAHIDSRVANVELNKADKVDLAVIIEKMNRMEKSNDGMQSTGTMINQQLATVTVQLGGLKQELTDFNLRFARLRGRSWESACDLLI